MTREEYICHPLFSVLIANYNNGCYLQEAIDSVLAQTYTNWEIVLVDDKSTDNSCEIYQKYQSDPRFHIYYNEENLGCGYTKRRCLDLAKGELCGFLDPDDKIDSATLEIMVAECEKHTACAIVYSATYRWDDEKNVTSVLDRVGAIREDEDYLISKEKSIFHFAVIRKSFYIKTIGIDPTIRSGVDLDLYLKLEEVGGLHFVDKPLYFYRQNNPNSISGVGKKSNKKQLAITHYGVTLNTFVRRIKTNSTLFMRNEQRYLNQMMWTLGRYKKLVNKNTRTLRGYCYWYLYGSGFSPKSFNHVRKILLLK